MIISFATSFMIFISIISASITYRADHTTTLASKEGGWGSWSSFHYCNRGHYAVGFWLKVEATQSGDDTSANGFMLICDDYSDTHDLIHAANDAPWGDWKYMGCSNDFIKGFRSKVENSCGGCDDTALNSVRAYCTDNREIEINSPGNWGVWGNIAHCAPGSIVCGFRQRVEASCGTCDDTALNAVQLACCQNSRSYSNGEGYWDPIYTGNSGVISTQTIIVGIADYWQNTFTDENAMSLETQLSESMSFIYFENSAKISLLLTSEQSEAVTANRVKGLTTTQTVQTTVSCDDEDDTNYYGLYQFIVSATEHGINQNSFTVDINTGDYWCSTVPNQPPKCPAGYCNHSDNCQTCVGGFQNEAQRFSKLGITKTSVLETKTMITKQSQLITKAPIKLMTKQFQI